MEKEIFRIWQVGNIPSTFWPGKMVAVKWSIFDLQMQAA
jgi:hypothetical protein